MKTTKSTPPPKFLTAKRIVLAMAIISALAVGINIRPIYRSIKSWRASRLSIQAEKFGLEDQWPEALQKVNAAYQLSPQNPEVLRTAARLYAQLEMDEALIFWIRLKLTHRATREDSQEFLRTALHFNRPSMAEEVMMELLINYPHDDQVLELAGNWYFQKGDRDAAMDFAKKACTLNPSSISAQLLLGRLLWTSVKKEDAGEGKLILKNLASKKIPESLRALQLLAQSPKIISSEKEKYLEYLKQTPAQSTADQFLVMEVEMLLKPEKCSPLLQATLQKYRDAGAKNKLEAGRWFNHLNQPAYVLELISKEESLKRQDLFLVRMDALAELKQWEEIYRILQGKDVPIEPIFTELYMARAAKNLNRRQEAEAHWKRLCSLALDRPVTLFYAAQYAEKIGEREEAKKIYLILVQKPITAKSSSNILIRMMEEDGDTVGLRDLMNQLLRLFPQDPSPYNDLAYLNLLLKQNMDWARDTALTLVARQPSLLSHRTTLALAWLRFHDPAAAMRIYQNVSIDWKQVLPGWQAVHAAVLQANGEANTARTLAEQIPLDRLKPEELQLIEGLVGKSGKSKKSKD